MNHHFNSLTHALAWLHVHGLIAEVREEIEEGDDDIEETVDYVHLKRRHGLSEVQQDWSKEALALLADNGIRLIYPPDDLFGAQGRRGRVYGAYTDGPAHSGSYVGGSVLPREAPAPEPLRGVSADVMHIDEAVFRAAVDAPVLNTRLSQADAQRIGYVWGSGPVMSEPPVSRPLDQSHAEPAVDGWHTAPASDMQVFGSPAFVESVSNVRRGNPDPIQWVVPTHDEILGRADQVDRRDAA